MEEKNTFIVRCGEVALKGMNKPYFERVLVQRISKALKKYDGAEVKRQEGLIFVHTPAEYDVEAVITDISKVFGVASVSHAVEVDSEIGAIEEKAGEYMLDLMKKRDIKTFKVEVKRADKTFPMESPRIAKEVGGAVLKACQVLKVDVHHPDCVLYVNVRKKGSFIFADKIKGFGGLPLGTNGKGLILLSGGIDSPVAGYMMAKRGLEIEAIHFAAPPYTSEYAKQKVISLCREVCEYAGRIKLHVVNFTHVQEEIRDKCPEEYFTIIMRRYMMKIAERLARENGCGALITGESVAQVASQTLYALGCTDVACELPVLRPVIGMDKNEIIAISRKIGTFETSILPYEDCCTVFTPRHPRTKPKLRDVLRAEQSLDEEALLADALSKVETMFTYPER